MQAGAFLVGLPSRGCLRNSAGLWLPLHPEPTRPADVVAVQHGLLRCNMDHADFRSRSVRATLTRRDDDGGEHSRRSISCRGARGGGPHRGAPTDLMGRRSGRRGDGHCSPCHAQPSRLRHRHVDGRPGSRRHPASQQHRHRSRSLVGGQQPDRPGHRRLRRRSAVRHAGARRRDHPWRADLGRHAADHAVPADHRCRQHHRRRVQRRRQHHLGRRPERGRGGSRSGGCDRHLSGADPGAGRAIAAARTARCA